MGSWKVTESGEYVGDCELEFVEWVYGRIGRGESALPFFGKRLLSEEKEELMQSIAFQGIDFFGLDDNLSLPVLFGLFCWASMWGT